MATETTTRTAAATAARVRAGQERKAAALRQAGWHVTAPEHTHPQKAPTMTPDEPRPDTDPREILAFMHAASELSETDIPFEIDKMHGLGGDPKAGLKTIKEAIDQGYRAIITDLDPETGSLNVDLEPPDTVDTAVTTAPLVLT